MIAPLIDESFRAASIHRSFARGKAGVAAAILSGIALLASAQGQTAQYSGAQKTLYSAFGAPYGVAVDTSGNVYVTDANNSAVDEFVAVNGSIPASPTVLTLGSGFITPIGIAVDGSGNVFVADAGSGAGDASVKEMLAVNGSVPTSPTILTLGSGFNTPLGVAVDGSGDVFVSDYGNNDAVELVAVNGSIPATPTIVTLDSTFNSPSGIAVDASGNVYVADEGNNVIDEIVAVNGSIPTSPSIVSIGGFSGPEGVAVDGSGDLYVTEDGADGIVQEVLAVNGSIPGTPSIVSIGNGFSVPYGVATDGHGNVFVVDSSNDNLVELEPGAATFGALNIASTSPTLTFDFTFLASGTISAPSILTQGSPNLDFADVGTGSCTLNGNTQLYNAGDTCSVDVTFTPKSSGARNGAVVLKDSNGNPIAIGFVHGIGSGPQVIFSPGTQSSILSNLGAPNGLATDGSGNVYVVDSANNQVLKETPAGGSYTQSTVGSGLTAPSGVAIDAAGNVYITDSSNKRVLKETPVAGAYTQIVMASGLSVAPQGIAVDGVGIVYVAANTLLVFTPVNGSYTQSTLNTQGLTVNGLALDGIGDIFLVDTNASEVISVSLSGQSSLSGPVGSGLSGPSGIAVDGVGNVYISDQLNNRIVKETFSNGSYTQSVLATGTLNGPTGVSVDSNGNVYVADQDNVVLREDFSDAPSLTFPTATPAGTTDTVDGALSVAIVNNGNATLTGALAVSASFSQTTGTAIPADCSTTLSLVAGSSCNVSVDFTPVASAPAGTVSGTELFTDNNLNANPNTTQTISLSGTTTAAVAGATHFAVTSTQSTATAGTAFTVTVSAEDASNKVITSYNGPAVLTSNDADFSSTGSGTFTSGNATFQVTLGTAGLQTITATSSTGTNTTGSLQVTVQAGSAATESIIAGTNQSALVGATFATQLQLLVADTYGNPVAGATVLFTAPSTGASASFAVPASKANQTSSVTGADGIATASIATANSVPGQYNVQATVATSAIGATSYSLTNLPASQYVVTVLADDAGTAGNCVDQANGSGDNSNCSLRDALAAINALPGSTSSTISFASKLTSTGAQIITLANGQITLANSVTIMGPGANLLSVSGGGVSQILTVNSGVTATISGLTLTNASATNSAHGGAINNSGNLSVLTSTISGNVIALSGAGGGIYNSGTLTVIDSTISGNNEAGGGVGGGLFNAHNAVATVTNSSISGNTTAGGGGSGIENLGALTIVNGTVSGNSDTAAGAGGGVDSASSGATLTLVNSIVAGNSAGAYADLNAPSGFVLDPSNLAGTDPGPTSLISIELAPLGNYGGSTLSMIPLPGSAAICGGAIANIPSGITTDQRGDPRTTTYASAPCVDTGAVQTNYSILFVQQPTDVNIATSIAPAPTVQLNENGTAFAASSETIGLTLSGNGTLTAGSASTVGGIATFSSAAVSAADTGDTLSASLTLNSATSTTISTTSNTFNVIAGVSKLAFGTPPAANVTNGGDAGSAITVQEENAGGTIVITATDTITLTVTGPNSYSQVYTAPAVHGVATFNLSTAALTVNGPYLYLASSGTLTDADSSETVSATAADTITILSGSAQSIAIGTAFSQALTVKVLDAGNNPVSGATVSFAAPASGTSARLSAISAITGTNGTASVTATANGIASTNPYSVVATVTGNSASFSLTNAPAASSLVVTPSSTGLVYGQPVTIKAVISPASVLTTVPSGTVTFYDGTTALTPAVTITSASASDTIKVPSTGAHTYQAQYGGDANFSATALKASTYPVVISKASATLNGPATQPVTYVVGTSGTTQVMLVGQYSGAGVSQPGGTVSFVLNGVTETATITNGIATIPLSATWPIGTYTLAVTYGGDGNYEGAPSISIPFSITAAASVSTTTTLKASTTTVPYGGSVTLTATVAALTGTIVPAGNVTFTSGTVTLGTAVISGTGVATYSATNLPVGTDSITASYGGNTAFAASVSGVVKVAVAPLATSTALISSNANASAGAALVFTATVTPKAPAPSGTVSFLDGTAVLGSGTVSTSGVATYSTSVLATGTHSITAVYAGNATDAASTSTALTETISAASAGAESFTLAASQTTLSIPQGQTGTVKFTLTSVNGFNQPVTLICSGLPANAICGLPSATVPMAAGASASITILTNISAATAKLSPALDPHSSERGSMTALAGAGLAGLTLLLGVPARKRLGRFSSFYTILMALVLSGALVSMSTGCGGGSNSGPVTPVGTSTVTVSATGGSGAAAVTKTVSMQLTITQ